MTERAAKPEVALSCILHNNVDTTPSVISTANSGIGWSMFGPTAW